MFSTPLFSSLALLTALTGCFHKPAHAEYLVEPCQAQLDAIQDATHDLAARKTVRTYLTCLVDADARVADVPGHVATMLKRNPYPATRRADIHGHFFNTDLMKTMPGSETEMSPAIEILEDQALARTAMGDLDMAQAARTRANRLETLVRVLEEVGEP